MHAERIRAMRAAHESVDEIAAVVRAYRDGGGLGQALLALDERWPELSVVPWRRVSEQGQPDNPALGAG